MRRRGCLITVGTLFGLLLLCCVVGWFAGIPRLRDSVEGDLSDSISTEVSEQIAGQIGPADAGPGRYAISVADMQEQLRSTLNSRNIEDIDIAVDSRGMSISFVSGGQRIGYSGVPTARDGELVMENMTVDNDVLGFLLPADGLGDAIESGVNGYFDAQGLDIGSLDLTTDAIEVEAVPESGT